jgi:hypothetical protein
VSDNMRLRGADSELEVEGERWQYCKRDEFARRRCEEAARPDLPSSFKRQTLWTAYMTLQED